MTDLVRRHPLLSFVVLANLLSWVAWLPYILSMNGLGWWDYTFPSVLGTSQLAGVLPGAYLGPITSAFLVTAIADGRPGLRRWLRRLWSWKVGWQWYAIVLLGVPAVIIACSAILTGGRVQAPPLIVVAAFLPGLILQMVTTGLAEEPGWRDFALPRIQRRFGPLLGAAILGPVWALWHLPLFLTEWGGWPDSTWLRPLEFTALCITFNVVMTWVFNRTRESVPLAMLLHVSVNNFMSIAWADMFPTLGAADAQHVLLLGASVAAAVVLLATRGRLGYEPRLQAPSAHLRPTRSTVSTVGTWPSPPKE